MHDLAGFVRFWIILTISQAVCSPQDHNHGQSKTIHLSVRPHGRIREGDTVFVTCEVKDRGHFDIVQLVKQINDTEYVITTNDYVRDQFKDTGRYRITNWNESGLVELQISHIRGVDSGNIGCKYPAAGKKMFMDIVVDVPPSTVELQYQAPNGGWYTATGRERIQVSGGVSCNVTVTGSSFKPEVIISIGAVEVTSRFRKKLLVREEDEGGFLKLLYSAEYVANLSDIEAASSGRNLTCWVKTEQHEPKMASFIIELSQKPRLTCVKFWYGQVGQRNFTLTCHGKVDHGPKKVTWMAADQRLVASSHRSESNHLNKADKYSSSFAPSDMNRWDFNLTIAELGREDFTDYTIDVTNEVGSSTLIVQLIEVNVTAHSAQNMIVEKTHILESGESSAVGIDTSGASSVILLSLSCATLPSLSGAISSAILLVISRPF